ncbi:MAG: signal peptidase I [Candidatus Aenigmatarchaeota archaeon]
MKVKIKSKDVLEIVVAFVVAWLFYQGLGFAAGTGMPIVSVVSESMEPVLHRGDLLLVTGAATADDLKIGDVVVYQKPEIPYTIVHRIIGEQTDANGVTGYIIKGDNNPAPDPRTVTFEEIKGKVIGGVPLLGYPRLALMIFGI